jgi:hypothetical protein
MEVTKLTYGNLGVTNWQPVLLKCLHGKLSGPVAANSELPETISIYRYISNSCITLSPVSGPHSFAVGLMEFEFLRINIGRRHFEKLQAEYELIQ